MANLFPISTGLVLLFASLWTNLQAWGGLGLIALGLLDNSFIPLPGSMDALTVILAAAKRNWWPYYALMATMGSIAGGYLTYRLGREGGEKALERRVPKNKIDKLHTTFEKGGFTAILFPGLLPPPVPIVPFLLAAGALSYPPRKFLAALATARAVRYFSLAFLASIYGRAILGFFGKYHRPILWILLATAALAGVAGLGYWVYSRHKSRMEKRQTRKVA
ncbi:MAG: VTT domain-containing protein [Acidobacteriales bacterium]|nr:VTT domain-containing protein [Terriglobales bacterium]